MRIPAPHRLFGWTVCLLLASAWLHAADTAADQTNRYIGTYEFVAGKKLRVFRDGDQLKAQPDGQLPSTLKAERQPGRFTVMEAPWIVQFEEDKAGVVVGLEVSAPDGTNQRYRRFVDRRNTLASALFRTFDGETSVNARVFNGYERKRGADGNFQAETYAVGNGGFIDSYGAVDGSIGSKNFKNIVRTVAPGLARQGYHPGSNPTTTHLLLMIYWGATGGKHTPAAQYSSRFREMINRENARTLGYESALEAYSQRQTGMVLFSTAAEDLMEELEEPRYWVGLSAFDFQTAQKEKKLKLLWTVRYNLPSVGTNFNLALPKMTDTATRYFGRDSGGLINRPSQDKTGHVELGETKILGTEPTK